MSKFMSLICMLLSTTLCYSQKEVTLEIEPNPIVVPVKDDLQIKVKAFDPDGNELEESKIRYFVTQLKGVEQNLIFTNGIEIDTTGLIKGLAVGSYDIFVSRMPKDGESFASTIQISLNHPV